LVCFFILNTRFYYFSWLNTLYFYKKYFYHNLLLSKKSKLAFNVVNNINFHFTDAYLAIQLRRFYLNLNIFAHCRNSLSNFRHNYLPSTFLNEVTQDKSIIFLLINTNLRFESPVFNFKIRQMIESNLNISIYSFGVGVSYNYVVNFLGNNVVHLFKKLNLINIYSISSLKYAIFGSYKNNYNFNMINLINLLLNNAIKPGFFNVMHVTVNSSTLLLKEVGLSSISTLFNNSTRFSFLHNNFTSDIYLRYKNKYSLKVFFGHHFADYVKGYNIIFPIKLFNEKPISYINLEGYVNCVNLAFDYKYSSVKKETDLIEVLGRLFNISSYNNNFEKMYNKNSLIPTFNKFKRGTVLYRLLNSLHNKISDGGGGISKSTYMLNLNSYITDFFLSDIVSRVSSTMSICSKKFTL
jgi:hypothetical protein